jgi:hypothetical protein
VPAADNHQTKTPRGTSRALADLYGQSSGVLQLLLANHLPFTSTQASQSAVSPWGKFRRIARAKVPARNPNTGERVNASSFKSNVKSYKPMASAINSNRTHQ